jgi:hypothetical protein
MSYEKKLTVGRTGLILVVACTNHGYSLFGAYKTEKEARNKHPDAVEYIPLPNPLYVRIP